MDIEREREKKNIYPEIFNNLSYLQKAGAKPPSLNY